MTAAPDPRQVVAALARRLDPADPAQQAGLAWFAARRGDREAALHAARRAVARPGAPHAAWRTLERLAAGHDDGLLLPPPGNAARPPQTGGASPLAAGVAAHRQGAPAVAEACYQAALGDPLLAAAATNGLAILHEQRGEPEAADVGWSRIDLDTDPVARHNAALAWWRRGEHDRALARLATPALETAALHHLAGWCLAEQGDLPAARRALRAALALDPDLPRAQFALGLVAERQHDAADALAATRRALLLSPWFQPLVWLLSPTPGMVVELAAEGNQGGGTHDAAGLLGLGRALLEAGHLAEALAMFDQALLRAPDAPAALFHRGVVLAKLRRYDEALVDWEVVGRVDPDGSLGAQSRRHARSARELAHLFGGG